MSPATSQEHQQILLAKTRIPSFGPRLPDAQKGEVSPGAPAGAPRGTSLSTGKQDRLCKEQRPSITHTCEEAAGASTLIKASHFTYHSEKVVLRV